MRFRDLVGPAMLVAAVLGTTVTSTHASAATPNIVPVLRAYTMPTGVCDSSAISDDQSTSMADSIPLAACVSPVSAVFAFNIGDTVAPLTMGDLPVVAVYDEALVSTLNDWSVPVPVDQPVFVLADESCATELLADIHRGVTVDVLPGGCSILALVDVSSA